MVDFLSVPPCCIVLAPLYALRVSKLFFPSIYYSFYLSKKNIYLGLALSSSEKSFEEELKDADIHKEGSLTYGDYGRDGNNYKPRARFKGSPTCEGGGEASLALDVDY